MGKIRRALLSVSDKTGIVEFAAGLAALGAEIVSTGGTARQLRESGVAVREVAELTGFPEMLDGRVKTLHPRIHGGILAVRSNPGHQAALQAHGIEPIDLVAINLYPFAKVAAQPDSPLEALVENIDIGGPAMIRSAAKNFEGVTVVVDPTDYAPVLEEARQNPDGISRQTRWRLACKAFATTAAYDGLIVRGLEQRAGQDWPSHLTLSYQKVMDLRYGENPHQRAALYHDPAARGQGLAFARQLQGKQLSFNNLVDLEAAWRLAEEFAEPATAIIKHTNPCGAATATTLLESYEAALSVDPISAFGSVIAFNRPLDDSTAEALSKLFVEAVIAPGYAEESLRRLAAKKNLRLVDMSATQGDEPGWQFKVIGGGLLVQTPDTLPIRPENWQCVTRRSPTPEERESLAFAWRVVKHVKSNAVVLARRNVLVGVGAGQMSRVDAVKLAISKARELQHPVAGTVAASDAFFPFPDGLEVAAQAGVTAVAQPGGSVRDAEVIAAADRAGVAMLFTGQRHFSH